jgi:hypothetical protein
MCSRVMCRSCNKVTYSGCGQHLAEVFAGVPKDKRCTCHEKAAKNPQQGSNESFFAKMFSR